MSMKHPSASKPQREETSFSLRLDSYVFHNFEVGFQLMGSRVNPRLVLFFFFFFGSRHSFASSSDLPY